MRKGWIEAKLSEVLTISRTRIDPSRLPTEAQLVHWSIPKLDETGGPSIDLASQIGSHKFSVLQDSVVYSLLNPRIPRFAIIKGGDNVVCSTEFAVLQPKSNLNLDYLYCFVSSPTFQEQVRSLAKGTTKSRERIDSKEISKLDILLPPLSEQRRIVDLIASVDKYSDSLGMEFSKTRNTRNSLLADLLTSNDASWSEIRLNELIDHTIGGVWGGEAGSDEVDVLIVRSTEFTKKGYLDFETGVNRSIKRSQLKSRELSHGDILLEKSGGGPDQPVGRVVFVTSKIPPRTVCSNFVQLIRPNRELVDPLFLFHLMWRWHSINRTLEFQAQTTGIRNLRTPDYLEQVVQLPPLLEQSRIVALIAEFDNFMELIESAQIYIKKLRSGLLSKLLSGDHEIPESYDKVMGAA